MLESEFAPAARQLVYNLVKSSLEPTDSHPTFGLDEVYFVTSTMILGHWKAMLSTTLPDGMYYEVVYNAEKDEFYLISYKRWSQHRVKTESIRDML